MTMPADESMETRGSAESEKDAAGASTGLGHTGRRDVSETSGQDVHGDEALKLGMVNQGRSWDANSKATYDQMLKALNAEEHALREYQADLRTVKLRMFNDGANQSNVQNSNLVVNSDALDKQHLAHRDIATDRTWNLDEVAALFTKMMGGSEAMTALVTKAVADAIAQAKSTS